MLSDLAVINLNSSESQHYKIEDDDFSTIEDLIFTSRDVISPWRATLYPVRTNNWKNFAVDLLLPTTPVLYQALKTDSCIAKIFVTLFSLILDAATFPIRLVTMIPRMVINASQPEHPLLTYLKNQNAIQTLLETDRVGIKLTWNDPIQLTNPPASWNGTTKFKVIPPESTLLYSSPKISILWKEVNFIERPAYINGSY